MMKTKYDDMRKGQLINIIITQNEIMENQRELIETLYEFREVTLDRLLRTKGNDLAGKDYGHE